MQRSVRLPCINSSIDDFDLPALIELAEREETLCGKDGKTGQTLYKTAIAPLETEALSIEVVLHKYPR